MHILEVKRLGPIKCCEDVYTLFAAWRQGRWLLAKKNAGRLQDTSTVKSDTIFPYKRMPYKIFVTRNIQKPGLEVLEKNDCELTVWDSADAIPYDKLVESVKGKGYDGILCMLTDKIDAKVLDAAGPQLQVVSTMSVGYEHIDLDECKKRNIIATNTPNVSTDSVAELTVSLLLLTSRRIKEACYALREGQWKGWHPTWLCGTELCNKSVGIFGFGRIGYNVARRIVPFGIKHLYYHDVVEISFARDVNAQFCPTLEEMLPKIDFLCICCNLTPQTRHRINATTMALMKKTAIIVNTGRGGVINHDDLYDCLVKGVIQAAGLDVTEPEPLPMDHKLVKLPNCCITPHMGSNTWDSRDMMSLTAGNNILAVFNKGQPVSSVAMP